MRTYKSEIPSLGSSLALIDMQLLINEVEKLSKEVDVNNPYAHKLAQVNMFKISPRDTSLNNGKSLKMGTALDFNM